MPLQEVSINRVEGLGDVLQPGEIREFFIMSEENEDGLLALSIRRIEYQRAWERVRQLQKEDATIYWRCLPPTVVVPWFVGRPERLHPRLPHQHT